KALDEFMASVPRDPKMLGDPATRAQYAPKALPAIHGVINAVGHSDLPEAQRASIGFEFVGYAIVFGDAELAQQVQKSADAGNIPAQSQLASVQFITGDSADSRQAAWKQLCKLATDHGEEPMLGGAAISAVRCGRADEAQLRELGKLLSTSSANKNAVNF